MRFASFLRVQIYSWNANFRELCSPLHQGEEQSDIVSGNFYIESTHGSLKNIKYAYF